MNDEVHAIPDQENDDVPQRPRPAAWSPLWEELASIVADASRRGAAQRHATDVATDAGPPPDL
jgi:hypothetical protein